MHSDYIPRGRAQPEILRSTAASLIGSDIGLNNSPAKTAGAEDSPAGVKSAGKPASPFTRRGMSGPDVQEASLSFDDFIDIVNPLQHIPVVNALYREITGDKISGVAQVAGSALYGGPLGLVSGVASAIVQQETGKDPGAIVIAALSGEKKTGIPSTAPAPAPVMVAEAPEAIPPSAPEAGAETIAIAAHEETAPAPTLIAQTGKPTPATPAPVDTSGMKFYSLAKVPRAGHDALAHMPIKDGPDVRLKSINRQAIAKAPAADMPVAAAVPLAPKDEAAKILGLAAGDDAAALAHATTPPAGAPGSNPLPPQLIQDMMLMNMQKYQDGLKSGTFRSGALLDVEG